MVLQAHAAPAHRLSRVRAFCAAPTAKTGIRVLTDTAHHTGRLDYVGLRAHEVLSKARGSQPLGRNCLLSSSLTLILCRYW